MDRPRLIRGLRIAWSAWWGIVCILLIALWVRSYWRSEGVTVLVGSNSIGLHSFLGEMKFNWEPRNGNQMAPRWKYASYSREQRDEETRLLAIALGKTPNVEDRS